MSDITFTLDNIRKTQWKDISKKPLLLVQKDTHMALVTHSMC